MLTRENFTKSHIDELRMKSKRDPVLLERAVYAFGLLEAISRIGLPFIFKGGTCLMLLLQRPMRLSADIDILVEPGTDLDAYVQKSSVIFPFVRCEEQKRVGNSGIEKRHFKFTYDSPTNGKELYILLDVLFEENPYAHLLEKEISNELLLTQGEMLTVKVPNVNGILADKLTAFAPHTTGIPLNVGKDMEVMKQMYDVCTLIDAFTDFAEVRDTYMRISKTEIAYRGTDIKPDDALMDTFQAAACIASRGKMVGEYKLYVGGIRDLRGHIFAENYSPEIAAVRVTKIMYAAACLRHDAIYERVWWVVIREIFINNV
jgi:predicted nucleotidyltransferase component of viral defense system